MKVLEVNGVPIRPKVSVAELGETGGITVYAEGSKLHEEVAFLKAEVAYLRGRIEDLDAELTTLRRSYNHFLLSNGWKNEK